MSWLHPFHPPKVPVPLVLNRRPDAPHRHELRAGLRGAGLEGYGLREVDVDQDAALRDEYGWRVPVLEIAGELAFEGRLEPAALRKRFAAIAKRYRFYLLHGQERG